MPAGRPLKINRDIRDKIVAAIKAGNYIETAAAFAGVSKVTIYSWLKKGAADTSGPFYEFAMAVEQALALAEVRDVAIIAKAAETQWQASAWRLERKFPERWGRKERIALTGESDNPVQVSFTALVGKLQKAAGEDDDSGGESD